MISDKFRHQLRQEAKLWRAEGLIDAELYQQLSQRYQFDSLEFSARYRFIAIFLGLGGVLIGLAVITFVAANWQVWSREFRVGLLFSVFIAINACGFYLWRITPNTETRKQVQGWQQRLGQGLLLLGALILGANMALMAQMFHIGGSAYGLYLVWGLGVLAMAAGLRLTSLSVLSMLLIGWGYLLAIFDWESKQDLSWLQLLVQYMPVFISLVFVPLAYWCRSRAIFSLAGVGVVGSLLMNVLADSNSSEVPAWIVVLSICSLPPALLWGYDDTIFPKIHSRFFQPIARNLSLLFLSIIFYTGSFHWWSDSYYSPSKFSSFLDWHPFFNVLILTGFTVFEWMYLSRQQRKNTAQKGVDLTTNVIACFIAISTLIPLWHFNVNPIGILATFLFNVLLFLLGSGLIREGLALGTRRTFWGGLAVLTLQIISRMLEYDTELIFKAFVFFLCGVGVIVAGLWFERYSSALNSSKEKLQ